MELSEAKLESLLEKAAERGARNALQQIGLSDEKAGPDLRELRNILEAFRSMRHTMAKTIVSMCGKFIVYALLFVMVSAVGAKTGWLPRFFS